MDHVVCLVLAASFFTPPMFIYCEPFALSTCPFTHLFVNRYEYLKKEARSISPDSVESASDLLLASGLSKMTASLVTYPHEVIRSRMMDARGPFAGENVLRTAKRVVKNEGWGSLYAGIHVSLLRVVPNCCITFVSYELILRWAREGYSLGAQKVQ